MSTIQMDTDRVIIEEYRDFNIPADPIVSNSKLSRAFAVRVNSRLPPTLALDLATLKKRLLNLRRKGQEKGGLPRLRRCYKGRGPNKPR